MKFEFQRGDTVRMFITEKENDLILEHVGLILEVTGNEITVRRDSDASIWRTDLTGKKSNVYGDQYIQLQKIFDPKNSYKGKRVEYGTVSIEGDSLKVRLYTNGECFFEKETNLEYNDHNVYFSFHEKYEF